MTFRNTVLATLAYADVFDYPLTCEEVGKWLVKNSKFKIQNSKLKHITEIKNDGVYYFLKGRRKIFLLRKQRGKWAKEKMQKAKRAAALLKVLPTIQLVGVTGALAMDNAHPDDDIDFYVITSSGTLWTTRFFATILLALFGLRRKPGDRSFRNKICLNMYVDEDHLAVPRREQDLFSAHEVLQMKPLWGKDGTYQKFLLANQWVKFFLPNAWGEKSQISNPNVQQGRRFYKNPHSMLVIEIWSLRLVESLAKILQLWYMRKRRSTEIITDNIIRFHPRDARVWVKDRYRTILARYKIPLDKIFYAR
ncbi:hypothetical protein HY086_03035 [Candidatus Gottesmanbacteria bacterium]|nr:hypothetical protein [Candidatus Gottesmanbacteria bacterium]